MQIIRTIDEFLNNITMYNLTMYGLLALAGFSLVFSILNILPYPPYLLVFSLLFIFIVCWTANRLFSAAFEVPVNKESVYITALILFLIITPPISTNELMILFWAGVLAMASKFILTINNQHIFNPVAISLVILSLTLGYGVSWWVGNPTMFPALFVIGILITRKIKRFHLVIPFFVTALTTIYIISLTSNVKSVEILQRTIFSSSLVFFGFIMLTEPLTTPPTKIKQILYGLLVGILFSPRIHIGDFYSTPELALVIGNLFSFAISPKSRYLLKLDEKIKLSDEIYDFVFTPNKKLNFTPGQYLEVTLPHHDSDNRGLRRYLSIASSPTRPTIDFGVKIPKNSSTFKAHLLNMKPGDTLYAGQLAGDFTLLKNKDQKLIFIAGGIGITPFRSMMQYLVDKKETRNIILFYTCSEVPDFVYLDIFKNATSIGVTVVFVMTHEIEMKSDWLGETGYLSDEIIKKHAPDYKERIFYISGPNNMVQSYKDLVQKMGVSKRKIVTDYFPGY